jgi:hypothetical protein
VRPGSINGYRADWDRLAARLLWLHGPNHAKDILAGRGAATNADLRAWRGLGGRK